MGDRADVNTLVDQARAEAVSAVQDRAELIKEIDDLKYTMKMVVDKADSMCEQALEAKKEARRTKTALALSFVKLAAGRQAVCIARMYSISITLSLQMKKLMEVFFHLEDGGEIWQKLAVVAEQANRKIIELAELIVVEGEEHVAEGLVHKSNGIRLFRDTVNATWFSCQTI